MNASRTARLFEVGLTTVKRFAGSIVSIGARLAATAWFARVAVALTSGCGGDPPRVQLVPVEYSCGRPANANQLAIAALTERGEVTRAISTAQAVDITNFPLDTKQLTLEIIVANGERGAIGKTLPLAFDALADGAIVPLFMAPPDGFCPVGDMIEARKSPLIARAGDGALVVGGTGDGGPLATAEYYDPRAATFAPVEIPEALRDASEGLAGVVLTTLPDGRVALSGGARGLLAIFDPTTQAFDAPRALATKRAFHGAAATARGLLVTGGCDSVAAQTCSGLALHSTVELALDGNSLAVGPNLPAAAVAEGGELFDLGDHYIVTGGFGAPDQAFVFALGDSEATPLVGLGAQPSALDGGALLTAFGVAPSAAVRAVTPSRRIVALGDGPERALARLITLEDGRVVALGGGGPAVFYDATGDQWEPLASPTMPPLDAPSLVRLGDGTVLVVGGAPAATHQAFVLRPSLVGPLADKVTAVPSDPGNGVLVPSDPSMVMRTTGWQLVAADDTLAARALVGGPRMARGSITATVTVAGGGVALIGQQVAPERALVARLAPGRPAELEQLGGGVVCSGSMAIELPSGAFDTQLAVTDRVQVKIGANLVLDCPTPATVASGSWGIAALGVGARVSVVVVEVAR